MGNFDIGIFFECSLIAVMFAIMNVFINHLRKPSMLCVSGLFALLASCGSPGTMEVRQFHLKSVEVEGLKQAPMVRGEQMYRLRGAVSMEERRQRLGQYYTVSWKNDGSHAGAMKIVMDYQQAATGSEILSKSRDLPAGQASGRLEFKVSGEDYRTGGRVLAWRIRMLSGNKIITEKRSYLWK